MEAENNPKNQESAVSEPKKNEVGGQETNSQNQDQPVQASQPSKRQEVRSLRQHSSSRNAPTKGNPTWGPLRMSKETTLSSKSLFSWHTMELTSTAFKGKETKKDHLKEVDRNKGVFTVEDALEKALLESDLIPESNFGNLRKSGWGKASRTDKGVHAAMNGITVKINIKDKFLKDGISEEDKKEGKAKLKLMIDRQKIYDVLNANLSDDIKIFGTIWEKKN